MLCNASPFRGLSCKKFTTLSIYLLISKPFLWLNAFEHFILLFKLQKIFLSFIWWIHTKGWKGKVKSQITETFWLVHAERVPLFLLLSCSQVCGKHSLNHSFICAAVPIKAKDSHHDSTINIPPLSENVWVHEPFISFVNFILALHSR